MKKNNLSATALHSPHTPKPGLQAVPKLVFFASLSLYVIGSPATADDAVALPDAPSLDADFRCTDGGEGGLDCPVEGDSLILFSQEKYLLFDPEDLGECGFSPALTQSESGTGVSCGGGDPRIDGDDRLRISVFEGTDGGEGGEGGTSLAMEGIYLSGLMSDDSEGCSVGTEGTVEVDREGAPTMVLPWTSDDTPDGPGCAEPGVHSIFVDFGGAQNVTQIRITEDSPSSTYGVWASGLELAGVSQVGNPNIHGGDLQAIILDPGLAGTVTPLPGFPIRVLDPRGHCAAGATSTTPLDTTYGPGGTLVFDGSFTTEVNGVPGETVELEVSTAKGEYFTVSAKGCGVPRFTYDGEPVPRGALGSKSYLDIVALVSDIVPVSSTFGFESRGLDATEYACQENEVPLGEADLNQPFLEINARDDEIKYLAGTDVAPGIIDPVGRDIMIGCGSKRGGSRNFSFVAWNLIHALQTDMRTEIGDEIDVLRDTVARVQSCVDPVFHTGQLVGWPFYIKLYYDYAASLAVAGDPNAWSYFGITEWLVELFQARLELPGVADEFEHCYASGPELDHIIGTMTPTASEKPLNAYGDIISQLQHLTYALRAFHDELIEPPPP